MLITSGIRLTSNKHLYEYALLFRWLFSTKRSFRARKKRQEFFCCHFVFANGERLIDLKKVLLRLKKNKEVMANWHYTIEKKNLIRHSDQNQQ